MAACQLRWDLGHVPLALRLLSPWCPLGAKGHYQQCHLTAIICNINHRRAVQGPVYLTGLRASPHAPPHKALMKYGLADDILRQLNHS